MLNLQSIQQFFTNHPTWSLSILRIGTGIMFAVAAFGKVAAGSGWPPRMVGFINFQADKSYEFYRAFLEAVVIPNQTFFGYFVAYGEVFVALSLILGVFTRWGAALGLFLVCNFLLAKGGPFWMPSANDPMYILVLFALTFTDSAKVWSLDNIRRHRAELQRATASD